MAPPVYVRHEIVHNRYVVESLKAKGAVFVEELSEIPETDAPVIFSAHGVPKSIPEESQRRNFFALDATCPLVTKVHREAEIHFKRGREIVLIGHAGHPEVVGTLGQLPEGAIGWSRPSRRPNASSRTMPTSSPIDADHAVARRHRRHRRGPQAPLSEHRRPAQGGHLLRHHQPPGGGQARGAAGRRTGRGRSAELLELPPSPGGRRTRRVPLFGAGAARGRD